MTKGDRNPNRRKALTYILALLIGIWTILPIYWLFNLSLMFQVDTFDRPPNFVPNPLTISNYRRILGYSATGIIGETLLPSGYAEAVIYGLKNSLLTAGSVTALTLVIALPIAYALGRLRFRKKNFLLFAILTSRTYPPISILIPFFALYMALGLLGTLRGLIIVYLTSTIPMIIWIMMGYFAQLPKTAENEGRIDGCTRFQAFYKVLLPMARPGIATAAAITFMLSWNEFAFAFILNGGTRAQTLPPILASAFVMQSSSAEMAAIAMLGIVPPAILAFIFQQQIRRLNIVQPF